MWQDWRRQTIALPRLLDPRRSIGARLRLANDVKAQLPGMCPGLEP